MGKFTFTETDIPGVVVIEPQVFGDDRGYFMETYKKGDFAAAGIDREFVQDNQSRSTRGVLRGLHFQKEHTQGKLVRVTLGEVYDVAVDCRPHSETFGKWVGVTLSAENKKMFYIPEGFAHGFLVLSDVAELASPTTTPRWGWSGPTAAARTRPAPRISCTPPSPSRPLISSKSGERRAKTESHVGRAVALPLSAV